ncbi:MAG: calcium/sodium antiporter, partial [Gammaproteobacteria bacterium]|nr:calcium/sodium antiporter [Gammaproteobacteria bacterium]
IGVTIVGFGTSAPELMVSASAAAQGLTAMAVGNALGSNIANVGLVLGATALVRPITAELTGTVKAEVRLLIILTALAALVFVDSYLGKLDALLLLAAFLGFMVWIIRSGKRKPEITQDAGDEEVIPHGMTLTSAGLWLAVGLVVLLAGSNALVWGAEHLALELGFSELVVGLTIVAIGTSLPELAVSLVSAVKGRAGIAIGNIIGSNLFNLLAVVGIAGLIHPAALDGSVLKLHYPVMAGFTLALLLIAYNPLGKPGFGRGMGTVLLAAFIAYQVVLLTP